MDILNIIGGGLTSAAAGGILGMLGSVLGRVIGIWEAKEKRKDQAAVFAHEIELTRLQAQARAEDTEHELAVIAAQMAQAANAGSYSGLQASIEAQAALTGVTGWVKDVLALIRPGLTLLLMLAMIFIILWLKWSGVKPETYDEVVKEVVYNILFLGSTSLLWWFGDRVPTHPGKIGGAR